MMLEDDDTASETFELYGPTNYSVAEIAQLVDWEIFKKRRHINVPKFMLQPAAKILNQVLWWKTTSADEVEREYIDQVIDRKAKTFADFGIKAGDLSNFTFHYLVSPQSPSPLLTANHWLHLISKITGVLHTTIYRQQRSGRRERKRSSCMFSTTSDSTCLVALKL